MAQTVTNGNAVNTSIDEISKPPAGVVLPPKDIRAIVEKTAGYVARNGAIFEDRIRQKEISNPKFSFLGQNDAYNAFYLWRLSEVREGRGTAISAGRAGEEAIPKGPEKPEGPPEPPEFQFSARMPNISAQDLEVVKLTALFVAKNGRSFMTTLLQKEAGNFQFDFLRPQHSLYQFFSRLVDQYTELLQAGLDGGKFEKIRMAELEHNVKNKLHMLERARKRAEWVRYQEQQRHKQVEEAEAERLSYAQIDWHDFVVVETVVFSAADDQAELPPPTSLADLQSASLEQKAMMSLQPNGRRIEEAMPTDEDPTYYSQQAQAPAVQVHQKNQTPQPVSATGLPPRQQHPLPQSSAPEDDEEEQRIRERQEAWDRAQQAQAAAKGATGPMRIRNDYVPRAQAKRQNIQMALCPNCKEQIPVDELEQHMRSKFSNALTLISSIALLTIHHSPSLQSNFSIRAGKSRKPKPMPALPPRICQLLTLQIT